MHVAGVLAAPLVLGTLGGTGGKFLSDILMGSIGMRSGASASSDALLSCAAWTPLTSCCAGSYEATVPTFAWRSGALGSLSYLLLVHTCEVRAVA